MFKKAKQNRVFEDVVSQIKKSILNGEFKCGEILPSERALKDIFSISRGTLREALRVCEQMGLIEIKLGVGGGAMVRGPSPENVSESLALLIRHQKISLNQLAEFRKDIEGTVARLAVERAENEDIQYLKELLNEAKIYLNKDRSVWDEFIKVDKQFHIALARSIRNPIYEFVLTSVHDNIHRYYNKFHPKTFSLLEENYRDLQAIVTAIEKRQALKASSLAIDHVKRFNQYMIQEAERKTSS